MLRVDFGGYLVYNFIEILLLEYSFSAWHQEGSEQVKYMSLKGVILASTFILFLTTGAAGSQ